MATVQIVRNNIGQAIKAIDMVDSPDDNGWYFHEYDFVKRRDRTSKKIFPSAESARQAYSKGVVKWEPWR